MSEKNKEKLSIYIKSYTPLIYIVTPEEDRVCREIETLSKNMGMPFRYRSWSPSAGFVNSEEEVGDLDGSHNPMQALREIIKNEEHTIYVLKDFDIYLRESNIVRLVKEIALKSQGKETVIILSHNLEIPGYFEKYIRVLDWDFPDETEIGQILEADEVVREKIEKNKKQLLVESAKGLTKPEIDDVLAIACTRSDGQGLPLPSDFMEAKKQIIRKCPFLDFMSMEGSEFCGYDLLKEWFRKRAGFFSPEAKEFGLPPINGVALVGPPGVGKSTAAREAARMINIQQIIDFDIDNVFESTIGSSEQNMGNALKIINATAPNIVFLDEFEKMIGGIQSSAQTEGGVTEHVVKKFLRWCQEREEKNITSVLICTINNTKNIPPEMLRGGGRVDKIFFLDLPNVVERKEIFSSVLKRRNRQPDKFDLQAFAEASARFSGAEIAQAVGESMFEAFDRKQKLGNGFIMKAIESTTPLAEFDAERIEGIRKWAENAKAQPASSKLENKKGGAKHLKLGGGKK